MTCEVVSEQDYGKDKKTVKLEKPSWCHMSIPVSYFGNLFWYSRRRLCCVLRVITLLQKLPAHNNRH